MSVKSIISRQDNSPEYEFQQGDIVISKSNNQYIVLVLKMRWSNSNTFYGAVLHAPDSKELNNESPSCIGDYSPMFDIKSFSKAPYDFKITLGYNI